MGMNKGMSGFSNGLNNMGMKGLNLGKPAPPPATASKPTGTTATAPTAKPIPATATTTAKTTPATTTTTRPTAATTTPATARATPAAARTTPATTTPATARTTPATATTTATTTAPTTRATVTRSNDNGAAPSAAPAPAPKPMPAIDTPSTGDSGPSADLPAKAKFSGNDMEAVLEQLAMMSQKLADESMLRNEAVRKSEQMTAREAELNATIAKLEGAVRQAEEEASKAQSRNEELKGQVAFKKAQRDQLELQTLRRSNKELTEKLEASQASVEQLTQAAKALEEELKTVKAQLADKQDDLTREKAHLVDTLEQLKIAQQERVKSNNFWQEMKSDLEAQLARAHQDAEDKVKEAKEKAEVQIKEAQDTLTESISKQNAMRQRSEGLAKELKQLLKSKPHALGAEATNKIRDENTRLKEELERKTKSLKDAMAAIMQMQADAEKSQSNSNEWAQMTDEEREQTYDALKSANEHLTQRVLEFEQASKGN
eukprot:g18421.t1